MDELGFDGRNTDLVVGSRRLAAHPDAAQLSNLPNIPLCPDNDPTRDNRGRRRCWRWP